MPPVAGLLPPQPVTSSPPFTSIPAPASTIAGTPSQPANTSPSQVTSTTSITSTSVQSSDPVQQPDTPSTLASSTTFSSMISKTSASHTTQPQNAVSQPAVASPTTPTAIAVIGSHTIGAVPGSSGVILPNGSTARPGSVATITDSHSQPVVVSVAKSGVFIGRKSGSSSFIPNPTIAAVPIGTMGNHVISAAPDATSVTIGTKTAFLNGPPVTVSGSIFRLTPTGVVVVNKDSTSSTTYKVPSFGSPSSSDSKLVIDGIIISIESGASTIAIGDQTITYGGSLVTLSNHDVLSLGPSGLVIQMPSGGVSTVTIPPSTTAQDSGSTMRGMSTGSQSTGIGYIIASSMLKELILRNTC